MGYIKHNAIIVTGFQEDKMVKARNKAIKIFKKCFEDEPMDATELIGKIQNGLCNGQQSFFIAPDGSKEGWETSDNGDKARKLFLQWLGEQTDIYCDWIEIRFGGDDDDNTFVRSS